MESRWLQCLTSTAILRFKPDGLRVLLMMAAPDYLKLEAPFFGLLFWGGIGIFLLTIIVVVVLSVHEEQKRKAVFGPILLRLGHSFFAGLDRLYDFACCDLGDHDCRADNVGGALFASRPLDMAHDLLWSLSITSAIVPLTTIS